MKNLSVLTSILSCSLAFNSWAHSPNHDNHHLWPDMPAGSNGSTTSTQNLNPAQSLHNPNHGPQPGNRPVGNSETPSQTQNFNLDQITQAFNAAKSDNFFTYLDERIRAGEIPCDLRNQEGQTLLQVAIKHQANKNYEYLLGNAGANPSLTDHNGQNALHYAVQCNNINLIWFLVDNYTRNPIADKYLNPWQTDIYDKTPLDYAIQNNECFDFLHALLVNIGGQKTNSSFSDHRLTENLTFPQIQEVFLTAARKHGGLDTVKAIVAELEKSQNLHQLDFEEPLLHAAYEGRLDTLRYFIEEERISPLLKTEYGESILHLAARKGCNDVIKYLLKDKNLWSQLIHCDQVGRTPLHSAARSNNAETFNLLMKNCSLNPDQNDSKGKTPYILALQFFSNAEMKRLEEYLQGNQNPVPTTPRQNHMNYQGQHTNFEPRPHMNQGFSSPQNLSMNYNNGYETSYNHINNRQNQSMTESYMIRSSLNHDIEGQPPYNMNPNNTQTMGYSQQVAPGPINSSHKEQNLLLLRTLMGNLDLNDSNTTELLKSLCNQTARQNRSVNPHQNHYSTNMSHSTSSSFNQPTNFGLQHNMMQSNINYQGQYTNYGQPPHMNQGFSSPQNPTMNSSSRYVNLNNAVNGQNPQHMTESYMTRSSLNHDIEGQSYNNQNSQHMTHNHTNLNDETQNQNRDYDSFDLIHFKS